MWVAGWVQDFFCWLLFWAFGTTRYSSLSGFVKLAYLADIFKVLNGLNLSLRRQAVTTFDLHCKTETWALDQESGSKLLRILRKAHWVCAQGETASPILGGRFHQTASEHTEEATLWILPWAQRAKWLDTKSFYHPKRGCQYKSESPRALWSYIFNQKPLGNLWIHVPLEYTCRSNKALMFLMPFRPHISETGFFSACDMKEKVMKKTKCQAWSPPGEFLVKWLISIMLTFLCADNQWTESLLCHCQLYDFSEWAQTIKYIKCHSTNGNKSGCDG